MTSDESVQQILLNEFRRRVQLNSRYSLRAFAKTLGLSSGALSEILNQRRPVSAKAAAKISKALGLTTTESKPLARTKLDEDTFQLIADWYHFAILNLLDCEGFRWNATYIAKRLAITNAQARLAMELLLRVGLVHMKDGRVVGAKDYVLSPSGVPSNAVRSYHRQILDKAVNALELHSVNEREFNGVGIALDPKRLPQLKREISDFIDDLAAKHSIGKRQEVFFFETALFQITKGETK